MGVRLSSVLNSTQYLAPFRWRSGGSTGEIQSLAGTVIKHRHYDSNITFFLFEFMAEGVGDGQCVHLI